jgi:uncharacterized protein YecE (DUF72 family)
MLEGLQLAVEFRNKSWFGEKTKDTVLGFEREHEHVVGDEPAGKKSQSEASAVGCYYGAMLARRGSSLWPLSNSYVVKIDPRHQSK